MSDTPKTDSNCFELEPNCYGGLDKTIWGHNLDRYVDVEFCREIERENTHLLVLASNAEFNASKAERENARLRKCMQYMIDNGYAIGMSGQTPDELCDDLLTYLP